MIPNIVGLLGITFPPGKKRNLALALFGSMAPVGAAGGSLVSAVIVQLSHFKWMFFLLLVLQPCSVAAQSLTLTLVPCWA
jgi:MFS family permease